MSDFVKPQPKGSRLAFLKTKRAIAVLTALVIVSAVLIALGVTSILTPSAQTSASHDSSGIANSIAANASSSSDSGKNDLSGTGGSLGNMNAGTNNSTADANKDGDNKDDGKNDDKGDGEDDGVQNGKNPSKEDPKNDGNDMSGWKPANSSSIAKGTPLRIMCLGASIIRGELSSDRNGFRRTLRADLAAQGSRINMVGTQRNGDMPDNDFEAYGGNRIKQIHDKAMNVVPAEQPNVFVINVGTNNVLQYLDTDVAGQHMEAFIDYLLAASPRSTVVLSTLLTNTVPNREPLILDINRQYRELFNRKYLNKQPVVLAELHPSSGLPGRPQIEDISHDGSHPTDRGYEIMGHILADAVKYADSKSYLRWPKDGLPYDGEKGRSRAEEEGGEVEGGEEAAPPPDSGGAADAPVVAPARRRRDWKLL